MWNSHKCFIYVWQQFFSVSLLRPIFSISSSRSGLGDTITRSFVVLCLSRLHARFLHKHRNEQKYGDFENAKDVLRRTAYLLLHDFFVEICLLEWWVGFYVFMVIVGNGWELLFPINIIYLCFFLCFFAIYVCKTNISCGNHKGNKTFSVDKTKYVPIKN